VGIGVCRVATMVDEEERRREGYLKRE